MLAVQVVRNVFQVNLQGSRTEQAANLLTCLLALRTCAVRDCCQQVLTLGLGVIFGELTPELTATPPNGAVGCALLFPGLVTCFGVHVAPRPVSYGDDQPACIQGKATSRP